MVTGQIKKTLLCWPAKFKPNLSHCVVLQNACNSVSVSSSLFLLVYFVVEDCYASVYMERAYEITFSDQRNIKTNNTGGECY